MAPNNNIVRVAQSLCTLELDCEEAGRKEVQKKTEKRSNMGKKIL